MKKSSIEERILYEDNHLIIVNKMPGEIVQGDRTGDVPLSEMVREYVRIKYNKPGEAFLGVVHRLDRPVSGAVIFARTSKALTRLNQMLKDHEIGKTYWAVVKSPPPENELHLIHYLTRDEQKNRSFAHLKPMEGSRKAELVISVTGKSLSYYLLSVNLLTGRHHQIRAQLSAIGCPIRGDLKYGYPRSNPDGGIHLHARKLTFCHPVRKTQIEILAAPPDDPVWKAFIDQTLPNGHPA